MPKIEKIDKMAKPYFKKTRNKSFMEIPKEFEELENETEKWYQEFKNDPKECPEMDKDQISILKNEADQFLANNVISHNNVSANPQKTWMKTMVYKGTSSDKMASSILLIQEAPIQNLSTLRNLVNLVKVGKKECIMVLDTVTELFLDDLLPPKRKLRVFANQPLKLLDELSNGKLSIRRQRLIRWSFENELKEIFSTFVNAIIAVAKDSVESNREKAVNSLFKLLLNHPEQEAVLLSAIANKLGDPSRKMASKAVYCLTKILNHHPAMREVVLEEIERILFRSGQSPRTQYYGICFLAQYNLDQSDEDDIPIASNLIRVYISFFNASIKQGNVNSRMMSALLLGLSRAFPLIKKSTNDKTKDVIDKHIDTIYRLVHVAQFNITVHALSILQQVKETSVDRFYSALYRKLQDPDLLTSTQLHLFLNLVYRSLKDDKNLDRIKVIIKRLLQVTLLSPPTLACAILLMISHVYQSKPFLKTENTESEIKLDDSNTETSPKFNIILANTEEKFEEITQDSCKRELYQSGYNPKQRNPALAGGQYCYLSELQSLAKHSHPTVALYAQKLIKGQKIDYSGDPLHDFTLIRFLERFSFKNPKQRIGERQQLRVTSTAYLRMNEKDLPVHERFMYKYLHNEKRLASFERTNKKKDEGEDEKTTGDVSDDELDAYLDRITGVPKDEKLESPEDLDFASAIDLRANKKKRKRDKLEEQEEVDDDEPSDVDIDEVDMDDMEYSDLGSDGEDLENLGESDIEDGEFSDLDLNDTEAEDLVFPDEDDLENPEENDFEDEEFNSPEEKSSRKGNKMDSIKKALKKIASGKVFASAEEFSDLLQDESNHYEAGSSKALSNKDKADVRQLKWEQKRIDDKARSGSKKFNDKARSGSKKFKKPKFNQKRKR